MSSSRGMQCSAFLRNAEWWRAALLCKAQGSDARQYRARALHQPRRLRQDCILRPAGRCDPALLRSSQALALASFFFLRRTPPSKPSSAVAASSRAHACRGRRRRGIRQTRRRDHGLAGAALAGRPDLRAAAGQGGAARRRQEQEVQPRGLPQAGGPLAPRGKARASRSDARPGYLAWAWSAGPVC